MNHEDQETNEVRHASQLNPEWWSGVVCYVNVDESVGKSDHSVIKFNITVDQEASTGQFNFKRGNFPYNDRTGKKQTERENH